MSVPGEASAPKELNRLQHWFQTVITHAEGLDAGISSEAAQQLIGLKPEDLEKVLTRSRALTAAERLAIYANAYHTRLLECLAEVFPLLKLTLGEEGFNSLAFGYLQEYPSRSYTLNELGRAFPQYLEQSRPPSERVAPELCEPALPDAEPSAEHDWTDFIIDLARFEWGIYEVFDGEGPEGKPLLTADQVLQIPVDQWAGATLIPVVSLYLLATRFPVNEFYSRRRQAPPAEVIPIPAPAESFVALTRRNFVVRRYSLSKPEYELLRALSAGQTVEQALESMLSKSPMELPGLTDTLKLWFRNWTAEGFFASILAAEK